jgi:CAAX protease family protein
LSTFKPAPQGKGWRRVLYFLVVFLIVSLLITLGWHQIGLMFKVPQLLLQVLPFALTTVITVPLFRRYADKKSLASLGFKYKGYSDDALTGFLFSAAILGTGSLLLYFTGNLKYNGATFVAADLVTGLTLMCLVAVAEETIFRGYILSNLLDSFNRWIALGLSAALFALVHAGNPGIDAVALVNIFIGGLILGLNYVYTRNLWFAIMFHLGWNFLQGSVLGFPVSGIALNSVVQVTMSGNKLLTGGGFGFEGSLFQTVLVAICIMILFFHYQRQIGIKQDPGG